MGDNIAGPSFLLARQDLAHREHQHQHNHIHLHRRQATAVVTEIVATVSVVQQVDVDLNGSTWSTTTLATDSSPSITNENAATTSTESPAVAIPSVASSAVESSQASQSLLLPSTSTTISIPTRFPTLILSSNSTSFISTIANSSRFTNSTTSRTSLTYITSSSTSDHLKDSSTSTFYTPSYTAKSSSAAGGNVGGTGVAGGTASTSTAASGKGDTNSSTASPPVIVGGVVGGVAGLAILVFLLMGLIRWWKKKHQSMLLLGDGDAATGAETIRDGPPSPLPGGMTQRRSLAFGVPAVLASMTGYKRASQKTETDRTISSTAGSERGFYRVSGRKLPSVLQSGGDGYGGEINTNTLSGSSFYRDSQGFYGGPGSPTSPSHPPSTRPFQRDSGIPVMRPSPARTPVTEQSPFSAFPTPLDPPPPRPDVLTRSQAPSQDGSQRSRFTEEV
ncbi:hypothetical protein V8E51_011573 [Hyaloscypha variabilis]